MAFNRTDNSGTLLHATAPGAENHIELLEMLIAMASVDNSSVQTVGAVGAAGTGYEVGDIIQIDGGTLASKLPSATATLEVLTLSGSGVDTVRLRNSGCYSTIPGGGGPYATTNLTDGTGTGFTINLTFGSNGWTINRQTSDVASAAVSAGGASYVNGESVTLTDFGSEETACVATLVVAASPGPITGFTIPTDGGVYHKLPATLVVTGGSGTGGIATPTYAAITDITVDREVIMTSSGGAIVGIRTFNTPGDVSGTAYNWEIAGIPAYNANADYAAQVNISPGRYESLESGQYVVLTQLTNPSTFDWVFEVNDRYIWGVFEVDTGTYSSMILGLGNPYGTTAEHAFPMIVGGCASDPSLSPTSNAASWLGMNQPIGESVGDSGPMLIYDAGGNWIRVRNGRRNGNDIIGVTDSAIVAPGGWFNPQDTNIPEADRIVSATGALFDWEQFAGVATGTSGDPDPPTEIFYPAPGTVEAPVLRECAVLDIENAIAGYMELPNVRHVERTMTSGNLNAYDETLDDDGALWIVFNMGQVTTRQHWFAVKASV